MFKIVRIPPKLHIFFDSLKDRFLYTHFDYFQILVVLMAFAWGRHTLSALYRHLDGRNQPHRSRFNNFLKVGRWDPKAALQQKAHELLAALCPKANEVIELILEDSKKAKRGQHMEAVGWIHDPTTGRTLRGHQYVCALLHFRGQVGADRIAVWDLVQSTQRGRDAVGSGECRNHDGFGGHVPQRLVENLLEDRMCRRLTQPGFFLAHDWSGN